MSLAMLTEELKGARRQVVTDGYEMSLGEVASLYRNGELVINPNYQRLFRWDESQKTRFVESLLLGIPIPPIFVFQQESGVWELIDGLQRVSTVLQLMGELKLPEGNGNYPPLVLGGTNLLHSLDGMKWNKSQDDDALAFDTALQLEIRRARIRVEILRKESDQETKFELFQRLNTGGSRLSEQEVRNSVLVMLNPSFYEWLVDLTELGAFRETIQLTELQRQQSQHVEMALRFIAYRKFPYRRGLDVNEYLDAAARALAAMSDQDKTAETDVFKWTFETLFQDVGADTFKRWNGHQFQGKSLISGFDAIAHGVAANFAALRAMDPIARKPWLEARVKAVSANAEFTANSGMGVRGTTRLTRLIPFGEVHFAP